MTIFSKVLSGLGITVLLSTPAWAAWELNNDESSLYYVTSKASAISEVNTFSSLGGTISDQGTATLEINLASVDTAIEIRDQRVRDILFEVGQYPTATVTLDLNASVLENMAVGSSQIGSYDYNLALHGMANTLSTSLKVTRLSDAKFEIASVQPVIINAGSFGLSAGVEALREVAGLPSINPNVVVNFSLVYEEGM